jgi:hypothetical protein
MSRSRLIFIVFYMTAVLITAVLLRTNSSRIFYNFRSCRVRHDQLKQQLWQKELTMASLTTPAAISERLKKAQSESDGQ